MTKAPSERIVVIQALRLLAALAVVIAHAQPNAFALGRMYDLDLVRQPLTAHGAAGVDLFFVISGFIMVHSSRLLYGSEGARRTFALRRLFRIVPLYWLATLFYLAWELRLSRTIDAGHVVQSMLFLPHSARGDGFAQTYLQVGWTLDYEMLFYLLFALGLGASAQVTVRRVAIALLALVAIGLVANLGQPFFAWTQPILLEFFAGMAIALAIGRGFSLGPLVRLLLVFAAVILFGSFAHIAASANLGWGRLLGYGLPATLIVVAATTGPIALPRPGWWNFGGDISYAIYLFHLPLLEIARIVWFHFGLPYGIAGQTLFIGLAIPGAIFAASLVYLLFDRPVTGLLNRRFAPRRVQQPLSASGV